MTARPPALEAEALAIGYRGRSIGRDLDLALAPGEVLALLGPNGSGKTTLFKTLLGLLKPLAGAVRVQGEPVAQWSRAAFARQVGYVPQAQAAVFPYTVEDVVLMGRAARIGPFALPSRHDREQVAAALAELGIAHLAARPATEISGGERQLALIARALVQQPALLVMDEPTASLDFGNQLRVLERIDALRRRGIAVLLSTHQPEHALRVADRVALLAGGRLVAVGPPQTTVTVEQLAALYGVSAAAVAASLPALGAARRG